MGFYLEMIYGQKLGLGYNTYVKLLFNIEGKNLAILTFLLVFNDISMRYMIMRDTGY